MNTPTFKLDIPQVASPTPNLNFNPSIENLGGLLTPNGNVNPGNLEFGAGSPMLAGSGSAVNPGGASVGGWGQWFNMDSMFGTNTKNGATTGWVAPAMQTFSGLTNAWLGMKQYGLAKDALKESKRQFDMDYNAQKNAYNESLETRQITRNRATNGQVFDSVEDTMKKYGVK